MTSTWDTPVKAAGDLIKSADWNDEVAWLKQRHKNYTEGLAANLTLTKDNSGIERVFFKDDFSNNTIANYTLSGSAATIAAGIMSVPATGVAYHTLTGAGTTGKWDGVVEFTASGAGTAKLLLGDAGTSYVIATRIVTTNEMWLQLYIGGVSKIANTDTATTLADSTFARVSAVYDGTSWQMYWNGVAVGANTASITVTTPIIGVSAGTIAGAWNELTYLPSVASTDSFATDTSTRYAQVSGTVAYDTDHLKLTAADNAKVSERLKSNKFGSGNRIKKITLPASSTNGDYVNLKLGATGDLLLGYGVGIIRTAGAWNICTVKDVTVTDTAVASGVADTNAFYIDVDWDSEQGVIYGYVYVTTKPTAPQVTIIDASYKFGYTGVVGFAASGGGAKIYQLNSSTIRAKLLIGETNIPATETGFYFMPAGIGQFTQTGTWTFAAPTLTCTAAGNLTIPFQTTIGVHTFTPTLANGTDYYYFGGYRIKFVASGGNQCLVTLETTAGVGQGTGSLTVTTTAGLFAAPIVITETATAITVTVAGAGGTPIVSGTTTSTNAYPKFTVGTATCTFGTYSFSGTRYYMKPMLRGAQIGEYYNGTTTVSATRFTDDFNFDTSSEWVQYGAGAVTWDTVNGKVTSATYPKSISPANLITGAGIYHFRWGIATPNDPMIWFASPTQSIATDPYTNNINCYYLWHKSSDNKIYLWKTHTILATTAATYGDTTADVTIDFHATNPNYIYIYINGVIVISVSDTTYTSGYFGYSVAGVSTYEGLSDLQINALDSTSTNGISITLGGVPHGARYDTQEEAYETFTNLAQNGEYLVSSRAKTTVIATADFEYYFLNSTDSTAINWNGQTTATLTPGLTYLDGLARSLLRYQDVGDTIRLSVRRKNYTGVTYDNQPAVFVDRVSYLPVWEE